MSLIKELFDFRGLNGQERLKKILALNNGKDRITKLRNYAKELGAISPLPITNITAKEENEIIKYIQDALRSKREEGLWKFAFLSAMGSIISAMTAIVVVIANK